MLREADFPEVKLKKNVKVIASLVRKAKKKLHQGKRDEALSLMSKAVEIDDNNGVLVQVIQVIGKKKPETRLQDEPPAAEVEAFDEEPEEPDVFTFDDEPMEPEPEPEPQPEEAPEENNHERNSSMASEDQINKLFDASDREFENGHQQKAIAYLKRAGKINPDNPEVQFRIEQLKTKIKAANLLRIAGKKLSTGDTPSAVVLARQAFDMMPDIAGLDEVLLKIESSSKAAYAPAAESDPVDTEAEPCITQVREMVQENSLEEAAWFAEQSLERHPGSELLAEFVENFRKLGLIE